MCGDGERKKVHTVNFVINVRIWVVQFQSAIKDVVRSLVMLLEWSVFSVLQGV